MTESETVRVFDCGCCLGESFSALCNQGERLENTLHDIYLDREGLHFAEEYGDTEYWQWTQVFKDEQVAQAAMREHFKDNPYRDDVIEGDPDYYAWMEEE